MSSYFSSLKIIDLSTVLAGPSVSTFFAELGAKVIKIENKRLPDVTRSWKLPSEDSESSISAYFASVNYRKEYLSLNLQNQDAYNAFLSLVKDADILITNFKKGDEAKLGLQDKVLRAINPLLIIGKISGFGFESDRIAYDLILQAETGFMSMNGTPESGPVKMPVALIDVLAAHHLKEGLLTALLERDKSRQANTIHVSLYDAAVCSLMNQASNYLMAGHVPTRMGSLHPNIAPYGELFLTSDEVWVTLAVGSDRHFEKLCRILQLEELPRDVRFQNNTKRVQNRIELADHLKNAIHNWSANTLVSALNKEQVPIGIVKDLSAVFEDKSAQDLIREEFIEGNNTKRVSSIAFRLMK
jgi:crotonobetainyl-CoA:carnitine CoA-transferase CaiB-like acyl-CoA transferase